MKHLKEYKLFESVSDIEDDVTDILSDIEDEGFSVDKIAKRWPFDKGSEVMKIFIEKSYLTQNGYRDTKPYIVNETMLNAIQHLSSYLSKNGYKLVIEAISESDVIAHQEYYHRDLGNNIKNIEELFSFIGRAPIDYLKLLIYKR